MKALLIYSLLAMSILFSSCAKSGFTDEERDQARLLIKAQETDLQAIQITNSGQPFAKVREEEVQEILRLKKKALNTAKKLPSHVLLKIHRDLPVEYIKYKEALSLQITSLQKGDNEAAMLGSKLHANWVDWFNANKNEFKVPK